MLKRLEVKHFKSLDDFAIDFEPFTVLIGQNASGKSSVLQALDLLGAFLKGDVNHYLKELGWSYSSSLVSKGSKSFGFEFMLYFETEEERFVWKVRFGLTSYGLEVLEEALESKKLGSTFRFLTFSNPIGAKLWLLDSADGKSIPLPVITIVFRQSILRAFKIKDAPKEIEMAASALEKFLFLSIPSTNVLRQFGDYQENTKNIGRNGEFLGSFLYALKEQGHV